MTIRLIAKALTRQANSKAFPILEEHICRIQGALMNQAKEGSRLNERAGAFSWQALNSYSSKSDDKEPQEQAVDQERATGEGQAAQPTEEAGAHPYADFSIDELSGMLLERDDALATCQSQLEEKTDQVRRTLADMENLRQRSARQAESTQKFAIQKFLKSMLDVGDNLERAYSAVPQEALEGRDKQGNSISADAAVALLVSLTDGVKLTEKIFDHGLSENGVEKLKPMGEQFDPNLHEALFEMPSSDQKAGTVGAVTKTGYTLQGRVVRPAQVGVVRQA